MDEASEVQQQYQRLMRDLQQTVTPPCSAVQCRAVQRRAVPCSAVPCSAVQCSAVQCSAVPCSAVQCCAVLCCALQCTAQHCSAVLCTAVQCNAGAHTSLRAACAMQHAAGRKTHAACSGAQRGVGRGSIGLNVQCNSITKDRRRTAPQSRPQRSLGIRCHGVCCARRGHACRVSDVARCMFALLRTTWHAASMHDVLHRCMLHLCGLHRCMLHL